MPGVFIYRFADGFNYANSAYHLDYLTVYIFGKTRPTELDRIARVGVNVLYNGHLAREDEVGELFPVSNAPITGPSVERSRSARPRLRAVTLDFSAVNHINVTSAQALVDLWNQLGRYASPNKDRVAFRQRRQLLDEEANGARPEPLVAVAPVESGVATVVEARGVSETESRKEMTPAVTALPTKERVHEIRLVPVNHLDVQSL